ncbi:MAG: ABC transporter substrate-binding protein, partial [Gemmatimonadota bacterium]|nr:ABC transporter substrate-binding protein [Gemmatimonadota bacterium]
ANPDAVILIGAYRPVATLIAWARHIGMDPVFMTISFVGSNALARELGRAGAGVFVTQVVPFPTDNTLPVGIAYRRALTAHTPEATPGFVSYEGYLAGRLAIAALERCGGEVNRTRFLNSLRVADTVDLGGFVLRYGANDNQGSDAVFLTVIGTDGSYRSIQTLRDAIKP